MDHENPTAHPEGPRKNPTHEERMKELKKFGFLYGDQLYYTYQERFGDKKSADDFFADISLFESDILLSEIITYLESDWGPYDRGLEEKTQGEIIDIANQILTRLILRIKQWFQVKDMKHRSE